MGRKIIAITLREDLINRIDGMVDNINVRSRSHAIEILLSKVLEKGKIESPKSAFVFATGGVVKFNDREIPRSMIPMVDKPILEYVIEMLRKYNIRNIIIALGENSHVIKDYFGAGDKFGVRIMYIEERTRMGTAGLLSVARNRLDDLFFVVDGDIFSDVNLSEFVKYHIDKGGLATAALTYVDDPSGYMTVEFDGERIAKFSGDSKKLSNLIIPGMYLFNGEIFDYISSDEQSLEKDIMPQLLKEKKLYGRIFSTLVFDTRKYEIKKTKTPPKKK